MPVNKKSQKCSKLVLMRNIFLGLTFIVVASVNDNPQKNTKTQRQPSSYNISTSTFSNHNAATNFLKNPLAKHTRKLSVPMMTHIKGPNEPIQNGETVTITGHLNVSSDIQNVKISWILPEGIELVKGSTSSFLSSTQKGQDYQFQITIKSNTDSNKILHLVAKTEDGSNYYSNSAQFHTFKQSAINKANKDLYERSQTYMRNQAHLEE